MTHDRPMLEYIELNALYRFWNYLCVRELEMKENLEHARRQGNDDMMQHYRSRYDEVLCQQSELLWFIHKHEKAKD